MLNLRTTGQDANPWLQTFMEQELKCHFQWSFNKTASKSCRIDEGLKNDYKIDVWVPLVENAVYALLTGASRTLKKQCGQTSSICDNYRANIMELVEQIKQVQLDIHGTGNRDYLFDPNGDGRLGYMIYMVEKQVDEVKYTLLGRSYPFYWEKNIWVNLTGESDLKCGGKALCPVCFPEKSSEPQSSSYKGFLYSTIALIILCIVSIAAVIFLMIKHRRKDVGGKGIYANPYITLMHEGTDSSGDSEELSYYNPTRFAPGREATEENNSYDETHFSQIEIQANR